MSKVATAVVGTGQTKHTSKRLDVSIAGLCRKRPSGRWPRPP